VKVLIDVSNHFKPLLVELRVFDKVRDRWLDIIIDDFFPSQTGSLILHGGRDDSILSAKLIRIAPETSSFKRWLLWREFVFFTKLCVIQMFYDYLRSFSTGYPVILRSKSQKIQNCAIAIIQKRA
jgi:hypothetical protein